MEERVLTAINSLGVLCEWLGDYDKAEQYSRQAIEGRRRLLGNDHPNTLGSINNLGVLLASMGRFDEAELYQREALAGRL